MIRRPAQFKDIPVYADDLPLSWEVPLTRNGIVRDLTHSIVTAKLFNDGIEIGPLDVDKSMATEGILILTLTQDQYDAMGQYSTWRLRESPVLNGLVVQGRLVKRL